MDKQTFQQIIQSPKEEKNRIDPDWLIHLIQEYPYFNSLYMLLAFAYHGQQSVWFDQWLSTCSTYANDRHQLYELLNGLMMPKSKNSELEELNKLIQHSASKSQAEQLLNTFPETNNEHSVDGDHFSDKKNSDQVILDNFLANYHSAQFNQKKPDDESQANIQESSGTIDNHYLSEDFALLCEQQGYLSKAIEIYEKLSLQYPDYFNYFAEKAEALKFNSSS